MKQLETQAPGGPAACLEKSRLDTPNGPPSPACAFRASRWKGDFERAAPAVCVLPNLIMGDMTLLGTFRDELIVAKAWKEVATQDDETYVTYWIQLLNGRSEVWSIHTNQAPELLTVLGQVLKCIRESAPKLTIKPEALEALSSRK